MPAKIRVRFVLDEDSSFEECNGEARPLTETEYADNQYMACPNHPRSKVPPARTENGRAWCGECQAKYAPIPYAEYLAYYGNPDRHVYLGCIVDRSCPTCGHFDHAASVWGIDFMDDSREMDAISIGDWMDEETASKLPGYAGDVAREQISEARTEAA